MNGGEIDLAMGVAKPLGAGFFRRRFRSLRFVCVVSKNHPTIQGSISLEQFLHASFIEYEPTGGSYRHFRKYADRLFAKKNIQRKVSVKVAYLSGIESIIASSDRIAVVTEAVASGMDLANTVQVIGLPFDIPALDVTMQWHERINKDPAQAWLHKTVIQVAEDLGKEDGVTPLNTGNAEPSLALASSAG
jgi:DNA-binding transcriptional LysR family regulator